MKSLIEFHSSLYYTIFPYLVDPPNLLAFAPWPSQFSRSYSLYFSHPLSHQWPRPCHHPDLLHITSHLLLFHTWPLTSSPIQISLPSLVRLVEFVCKPLTSTSLFCCTFPLCLKSVSLWQCRVTTQCLPSPTQQLRKPDTTCDDTALTWEDSTSQPSLLHLSYRGTHFVGFQESLL